MPIQSLNKVRFHASLQSTPVGVSGVHYDGRCFLYAVHITTDGINNVTVNIYDNDAAAAGKRVGNPNMVVEGTERDWILSLGIRPREMKRGIYIQLAVAGGGTCQASAEYDTGGVEV